MNTDNTETETDQELFDNSTGGKIVNRILERRAAIEAEIDAWTDECSFPLS